MPQSETTYQLATCDPREQLHKFVHGHFFLFVSESGLGDAVSPSPTRLPKFLTPEPSKSKNKGFMTTNKSSTGKGKKHKINIKPRFSQLTQLAKCTSSRGLNVYPWIFLNGCKFLNKFCQLGIECLFKKFIIFVCIRLANLANSYSRQSVFKTLWPRIYLASQLASQLAMWIFPWIASQPS